MIEDYLGDGLVEDERGGFKLACTPGYEAATYCAQRHDPWAGLRNLECPLVLLRAEKNATSSLASMQRMAALKPNARLAIVEGTGHMLPMERPDRVRAAIETALLLGGTRALD
jgi:pimeloyl-ACP methyl ester carboxylesterase